MSGRRNFEHIDTLVIGGGQAGLSVGYYLAQRGIPFLIVDANERVGDSWRKRWDSLRLFTPARYDGLPGMRFPRRGDVFISKNEMADYLESYGKRFGLPVRTGTRVERLWKRGDRFVASTTTGTIEADNVIVAMANSQVPRVPAYAKDLDIFVNQLHSSEYKNPSQLRDGAVLVVGVGNSGADIGLEVARNHRTLLAGTERGAVPFRIETAIARFLLLRLVRFVGHHVLTVRTPIGRKLRPKLMVGGAPLVRVKPKDLVGAGIERVPRVVGVKDGLPLLDDGRTVSVANVIWCTGYDAGFSWIDLPICDGTGLPVHEEGVVQSQPGLYFVGLHFLYSMTSETVTGHQRDAKRIVGHVAARPRAVEAIEPASEMVGARSA
jgi:putative flavoprotein involved in K+ transport